MKTKNSLFFLVLSTLLFCTQAHSAISSEKYAAVVSGLRLPIENRIKVMSDMGQRGFKELQILAFDQSLDLEIRWRALTSLGRIHPKSSQAVLERAFKSTEWFMRNAALIVAPYSDRSWAIKWSRILLHDQALVVRTAAVQSLRQLNATESSPLLWEKFYSSENYKSGKSLWIRRHILEALVQFSKPGEEDTFISVLNDKDKELHSIAIRGLKKLTQQSYTNKDQWLTWHSRQNKKI